MAVPKEEQELLKELWDNHKGLLVAMAESLVNSDIPEDDEERNELVELSNSIKKVATRDYTKYKCISPEGVPIGDRLGKGALVRAVVDDYVEGHNGITYSALEKAFPNKMQGSFGVFTDENGLKKTKERDPSHKCYNEDPIKLTDGTDVYVCTRWGKNINGISNIDKFIEVAQGMGYNITEVKDE